MDARADVYALGGVLHQELTNAVPYPRDSNMAKLYAHVHDPPPVPSRLNAQVSPALDAVVARAMAKAPEDRYPSAGDLGRAAIAAAAGRAVAEPERTVATGRAAPIATTEAAVAARTVVPPATPAPPDVPAPPVGHPPPPDRTRRRWPTMAAVCVALLLAGGLAAVLLTRGDDKKAASLTTPGLTVTRETTVTQTQAGPGTTSTAPGPTATTAAPPPLTYTSYDGGYYSVDRPAGWATIDQESPQNNAGRTRSTWASAACGCDLVVDVIPNYGKTALENANEVPGGSVTPAAIGVHQDAALRVASDGRIHSATYFIADGADNYAVKATAPSARVARDVAGRAAASLARRSGE